MRIRITFAKTAQMRYTSHLDLHRTWERTLRRARLPLAYSQGFNPHPRINLASALPLGFTGAQEVVDIWLEQTLPLDEVASALGRAVPPGIDLHKVEAVDERAPALQTELEASEYILTFRDPQPEIGARVKELLAAEHLPRERRGKAYDLRPLVLDLKVLPAEQSGRQDHGGFPQEEHLPGDTGQLRLLACLAAREGATGRPEEVIAALGIDPAAARAHRTRLLFRSHNPVSRPGERSLTNG